MPLPHALVLAEARSALAALADAAQTFEASLEYDRVLLQLGTIHQDATPAAHHIDSADRTDLYRLAESALESLVGYGPDALQLELLLAALEDARDLDLP